MAHTLYKTGEPAIVIICC